MAPRHTDETAGNEPDTNIDGETNEREEQKAYPTGASRRGVLRLAGAVAVAGLASNVGTERAAAAPAPGETIDSFLDTDSEVLIPPGTYTWEGSSGYDIGSNGAVIGDGGPGEIVFELTGGTMDGDNRGLLQNIVVRGQNGESKSGIDVYAGCTFDGFVWPDGGQQDEDRAMYTPSGAGSGGGRGTFLNSAWAMMANNGAYVDKIPHTFENCAALNNNVSGIRVGHREVSDPLSETTLIRNCLVAVVADVPNDAETSSNARGIRLRHDAHLVIEDCFFIYKDVTGASYPIDIEDDCPDSIVEIRNCTFYNESDNPIIIDETGGSADVTVENCVVAGPGSHEVAVPGVSSDAVQSVDSVEIPTPSALTGIAAADDVPGVEPGVAPWSDEAVAPSGGNGSPSETDSEPEAENTIVLHASPENSDDIDVSFLVDGEASYGDEAEADTDLIEPSDEGTWVTSVDLNPDALDSYGLTGPVIDYSIPEGATVDIAWNGTTTTFAELVDEELEDGPADDPDQESDSDADQNSDEDVEQDSDEDNEQDSDEDVEQGSDEDDEQDTEEDSDQDTEEFATQDTDGDAEPSAEHDILLHASPDNSGKVDVSFLVDGDAEYGDESESGTDLIETVDGGTLVTSIELNPDALDSYVLTGPVVDYSVPECATIDVTFDGESTTFEELVEDATTTDDSLSNSLVVDGRSVEDLTEYTFTVSGDVERDLLVSMVNGEGTPWDKLTDIARDGKVIGVVGDGIDAFRFSGEVIAQTINGDADLIVEMG